MPITLEQYKQRIKDVIALVETKVIDPVKGDSEFASRYITSEGLSDEDWKTSLSNT